MDPCPCLGELTSDPPDLPARFQGAASGDGKVG